jgi:XTP/dITP diphosphohydrolase
LATNNPNKVRELRALFGSFHVELLSLSDLGLAFTAGEDGTTFVANATQKARETADFICRTGIDGDLLYAVLADDSGLAVDALDGLPGVDSALYLGADTPFGVRNAHIIKLMKDVPDEKRTARFVCVAACVLPNGKMITAEGVLEGQISHEPAGNDGFGYDPIFFLPERGLTLAQLTLDEKNKISHRGKAMTQMLRLLEAEARSCKFS